MDSKHPSFYTWDESQAKRGSTEVGSALLHHLRSLDTSNIETVRLFCDGCGGQNKNSYIMHVLACWLLESPMSVKNIIIHFPVRGHSYLPADRAFGRVEKLLKRKNLISPEEYNEVYSNVGKVKILGNDWALFNIKNITEELYNKIPAINKYKRIELRKFVARNNATTVKYRGSEFYRFQNENEPFQSLVKRGRSEKKFKLKLSSIENGIAEEKKHNVKQLLEKQYNSVEKGIKWEDTPELIFFRTIVHGNSTQNEPLDDEDEACDCLELDCGSLHV
nr:unnamed protein product [Callosobruchus chinensis]